MTRIQLGAMGEALAVDHLTQMGLRILGRNWRCRYGELDVIACDDATRTVVFVEVKTRTGDGYGGLAHAVTPRKVQRLRRLAGLWLAAQGDRWAALRLDVIGVRVGRRRTPEITHLRGIG
jgi:putative endonuclease